MGISLSMQYRKPLGNIGSRMATMKYRNAPFGLSIDQRYLKDRRKSVERGVARLFVEGELAVDSLLFLSMLMMMLVIKFFSLLVSRITGESLCWKVVFAYCFFVYTWEHKNKEIWQVKRISSFESPYAVVSSKPLLRFPETFRRYNNNILMVLFVDCTKFSHTRF